MVGNSNNQHHSLASDDHLLPTEFPYDFASFTSPNEDNEDDFFNGLTRQFALSTLLDSNKLQYAAYQTREKWSLSGSPPSILSPVFSNGSPTGPLQGPSSPTGPFAPNDYSWDLIREAAGQVNLWNKLKNQQSLRTNRGLPCPSNNFTHPHSLCLHNDNHLKRSCESIWAGPQSCLKGPRYGGQTSFGANSNGLFNVNGFVGDKSLLFSGGRDNIRGSGCGGVKRKCAGTGVFLPRRCPDPVESRVKSGSTQQRAAEAMTNVNYGVTTNHDVMVMRRNAALAQQWRNGVKMMAAAKAMNYDTHLPHEWSY